MENSSVKSLGNIMLHSLMASVAFICAIYSEKNLFAEIFITSALTVFIHIVIALLRRKLVWAHLNFRGKSLFLTFSLLPLVEIALIIFWASKLG
jgi:hypothetical protein